MAKESEIDTGKVKGNIISSLQNTSDPREQSVVSTVQLQTKSQPISQKQPQAVLKPVVSKPTVQPKKSKSAKKLIKNKRSKDTVTVLNPEKIIIKSQIDKVYDLILVSKKISVTKIAKDLNINKKILLEWIKYLEDAGLVETRYPLIGEMEVLAL